MLLRIRFLGLAAIAVLAFGCGKSDESGTAPPAASLPASVPTADAKAVVASFLEALRKGDDDAAKKLLTNVARQKAEESHRRVVPAASDSAKIEVDEATYTTDHNIAYVPSRWIDLDDTGKPRTDKATWACRLEPEGWRVAGFAAYVFEGEDPLVLSFEDPDDMAKKQNWLKDEITRRARQEAAPATGETPATGQNPFQAEKKPQDAFRR